MTGRPPGEETPDLERPVAQPQGDGSEVLLALAVVGLLVLAIFCLTVVGVTALRGF